MPAPMLDRQEGRHAFGSDPTGYDSARPEYPEQVYQTLQQRCGLAPGTRTLEIGPGPGNVTRDLIRLGAGPMVLVEPDERFAAHLRRAHGADRKAEIRILSTTFDRTHLLNGWFDLAVAATSFHWLDELAALDKIARALRPGGWWAAWWNVYSDPSRPDEFFAATQSLLSGVHTVNNTVPGRLTFALDIEARLESLSSIGRFENSGCDPIRWTLAMTTAQTVDLYRTFPTILRLPRGERDRLLADLARISDDQFGGQVERPMLTPLYTARKR
jgi:SAM-dependent methyltransferase